MLSCREIARLYSESLEHPLPLRQRLQMKMHLFMCRWCSGFARQMRLLHRAVREDPERLLTSPGSADVQLSEHARTRIKEVLQDHGG